MKVQDWLSAVEAGDVASVASGLSAEGKWLNTFVTRGVEHGQEMWLPLHFAASAGAVKSARLLIERGGSVDCRTRFTSPLHARQTPLHLAASGGHGGVVALLLEHGASVEVLDAGQARPLHLAARSGSAGVVATLIEAGAGLEARDGQQRTALHLAILGPGDDAAALALIESGADVDAVCPKEADAFTPLHRCVKAGEHRLGVAERLVAAGADTSRRDPRFERTAGELAEALGLGGFVGLLS